MTDDASSRPNRRQRRATRASTAAEPYTSLDPDEFLKLADVFIKAANRQNDRIVATEIHLAFLFAAARYNAYVANVVLDVAEHEPFVAEMTAKYQEFLRQHLADPTLTRPGEARRE